MTDQQALFDVPDPERPRPASAGRGRTRETYARTVVAEVLVHDEAALAACPGSEAQARTEIEQTFAAVWDCAASPYAPLDEVPGIIWAPVDVAVEQIMSGPRTARSASG